MLVQLEQERALQSVNVLEERHHLEMEEIGLQLDVKCIQYERMNKILTKD